MLCSQGQANFLAVNGVFVAIVKCILVLNISLLLST